MKIYVEGKLKTRSWEKDGQIRRKTEIIAENVQILYKPEQYRRNDNAAEPLNEAPENANDEVSEAPETQQGGGFFNNIF